MRSQHFDLPKIFFGTVAVIVGRIVLGISLLFVIRDITGYFAP